MRPHSSQPDGGTDQPDLIRSVLVAHVAMTDPTGPPRLGKVQVNLYVDRYSHAVMQFDIRSIQANQTEK
jgi:hypothetical protein